MTQQELAGRNMDVRPLRGSLGEAAFERLREGITGGK
jgi:hypothetical protein